MVQKTSIRFFNMTAVRAVWDSSDSSQVAVKQIALRATVTSPTILRQGFLATMQPWLPFTYAAEAGRLEPVSDGRPPQCGHVSRS